MAASSSISTNINSTTAILSIKSINKSSSSKNFLLNSLCISKQRARRSDLGSKLKTTFDLHNRSKRVFSIKSTPPESNDHFQSFLTGEKSWINWIWGLVALVPLVVQRVLKFTKETETAAETVEKVADTVENVAADIEKQVEDTSETLPEGRKLKEVVGFVEKVAEETAKDAQLTEDLMDKVEEVDQEIESIITNGSKTNARVDSKDQD